MTEFWLSGPVDGVPAALTPVAHALLQTGEDVREAVEGLSVEQLWVSPGGAAALGFHLRHLANATDRLLTAARGEAPTDAQKAARASEKTPPTPLPDARQLVGALDEAIRRAIDQLRRTDPATLQEPRPVGRAALPTTVFGLLFHAAEHAQRHAGQVVTTAKIIRALGALKLQNG
jgi:uncharacterized damage-inducible protein DinB